MIIKFVNLKVMLIQIVDKALQIACCEETVKVVADDTDMSVLPLHFWNSEIGHIHAL